jgi:hypothetical protein
MAVLTGVESPFLSGEEMKKIAEPRAETRVEEPKPKPEPEVRPKVEPPKPMVEPVKPKPVTKVEPPKEEGKGSSMYIWIILIILIVLGLLWYLSR